MLHLSIQQSHVFKSNQIESHTFLNNNPLRISCCRYFVDMKQTILLARMIGHIIGMITIANCAVLQHTGNVYVHYQFEIIPLLPNVAPTMDFCWRMANIRWCVLIAMRILGKRCFCSITDHFLSLKIRKCIIHNHIIICVCALAHGRYRPVWVYLLNR